MRLAFLFDQNVPQDAVRFLRALREDWRVLHVNAVDLIGAPDEIVFARAQREGEIILTFDEDFADTRMFPIGTHAGVLRLRVWPTTLEKTQDALERLVRFVRDEDIPGSLIIIDDDRIRVRKAARRA